jgi:hypothetical protein
MYFFRGDGKGISDFITTGTDIIQLASTGGTIALNKSVNKKQQPSNRVTTGI